MKPENRVKAAWVLLVLTAIGGVYSVIWVAQTSYEMILMAISWGAITITCLDIVATTDVRANED